MVKGRWIRYKHRKRLGIEYDVEAYRPAGLMNYIHNGELCLRVRTIRNLSFAEEVHQPAFTLMPAEFFFDVYQRVEE